MLNTGLSDLDKLVGDFLPGQLIVVASRPAMGKTSIGLQLATRMVKQEKIVALFAIELAKSEIERRLILMSSVSDSGNSRINIDDTPGITTSDIFDRIKRIKNKTGKLDLVIISPLQLLADRGTSENRDFENLRRLKEIAKEIGCPFLVLSQLDSMVDERDNKRPTLADLRRIKSIESDADVILFLYRDELYNKSSLEKGITEIIVAKSRMGEFGTVKARFDANRLVYENLASESASKAT